MEKIELEVLYDNYPGVIKLNGRSIFFIESPFANCQSFCINNTQALLNLSKEELVELFKQLKTYLGKRQFVIDVVEYKSEKIIEALDFMIVHKQAMPYVSTNNTNMVLYLIQIDYDKLK